MAQHEMCTNLTKPSSFPKTKSELCTLPTHRGMAVSEVRCIKLPGSSFASDIKGCHKMEEGWKRRLE